MSTPPSQPKDFVGRYCNNGYCENEAAYVARSWGLNGEQGVLLLACERCYPESKPHAAALGVSWRQIPQKGESREIFSIPVT